MATLAGLDVPLSDGGTVIAITGISSLSRSTVGYACAQHRTPSILHQLVCRAMLCVL